MGYLSALWSSIILVDLNFSENFLHFILSCDWLKKMPMIISLLLRLLHVFVEICFPWPCYSLSSRFPVQVLFPPPFHCWWDLLILGRSFHISSLDLFRTCFHVSVFLFYFCFVLFFCENELIFHSELGKLKENAQDLVGNSYFSGCPLNTPTFS